MKHRKVLFKFKRMIEVSDSCQGGGTGRHAGLKQNLSAQSEMIEVELLKFGEALTV
jgi:hypothetical protein